MIDTPKLRAHQLAGARWLAKRGRAILGDAPRVGKTRTLLWGANLAGCTRIVVICPARVRTHWFREAAVLGMPECLLHVFSYEHVVKMAYPKLEAVLREAPDLLIIDEAHFGKNTGAKRAQMVFGKDGYARRFPRVWAGTGTLMPKRPSEAWPVLAAIAPTAVVDAGCRTIEDFKARFDDLWYEPTWVKGRVLQKERCRGAKNPEELQRVLAPIVLRRTLPDIADEYPSLDFQSWDLDQTIRDLADPALLEELAKAVTQDGGLSRVREKAETARFRRRVGELKAPLVAQAIIEELEEDPTHRVAVFAYHRDVLEILRAAFTRFGCSYVDGDSTPTGAQAEMDAFQQLRNRVFLGQAKACEVGISLFAADRAVLVEPSWTATDNFQTACRILDPIGERKKIVQLVSLAGTLDEAIVAQNRRETRMCAEVGWALS